MSNLCPNLDSMHNSSIEESYQFDLGIFEHADYYFHNEQYDKNVPRMHYESQESYFILLAELIQDFDVFGKTDRKLFFSLPQRNKIQNQVFDIGKKYEEI